MPLRVPLVITFMERPFPGFIAGHILKAAPERQYSWSIFPVVKDLADVAISPGRTGGNTHTSSNAIEMSR